MRIVITEQYLRYPKPKFVRKEDKNIHTWGKDRVPISSLSNAHLRNALRWAEKEKRKEIRPFRKAILQLKASEFICEIQKRGNKVVKERNTHTSW